MKILLICLLFLLSTFSGMKGCGSGEKASSSPAPPEVTVSRPVQQEVTNYLEMPGNLEAHGKVDLVARVEGYLQSVDFEDGAMVQKGQNLFVIEPQPYEAQVKLAEAAVAQEQATMERAKEEYERQQRLIKQRATSRTKVEQWRAQYESAQALVKQNRARLETARINLGYTTIAAPFDGRMERHLVDPGNLVGAGGPTRLATIYRLNPIYAYFNLNENELAQVIQKLRQTGNPGFGEDTVPVFLGVKGEEGYPHRGRLDYASASVDRSTGTLQLRGIFNNPMKHKVPELLPGMYARVRIPIAVDKNALLVPEDALGITQGKHFLLLVNGKDIVSQQFVTIGKKVKNLRVIEKGLNRQDWVVVSGIQRAHPGSKVTPKRKKHDAGQPEKTAERQKSADPQNI